MRSSNTIALLITIPESEMMPRIVKNPKIDSESVGGYGLKSTKERLQLAYPDRHTLEIGEVQNIYNVELLINTNEGNNS